MVWLVRDLAVAVGVAVTLALILRALAWPEPALWTQVCFALSGIWGGRWVATRKTSKKEEKVRPHGAEGSERRNAKKPPQ